jgi:hypothetical protein
MPLFLANVVDNAIARLTGPMSFRFILQPAFAVFLGIRDGLMDAKAGTPPFIADLVFNPGTRKRSLKAAFHRLLTPIIVATVLDAIAQYLIFKHVRPLAALVVGTFVMGLPYAAARGVTNRIVSARRGEARGADEAAE